MWKPSNPAIQVNCTASCVRPGARANCHTAPAENANAHAIAPTQIAFTDERPMRLPASSISAAPTSGNSGIIHTRSKKKFSLTGSINVSPLQQVDLIRQHCLLIAEQRDQNAQSHG